MSSMVLTGLYHPVRGVVFRNQGPSFKGNREIGTQVPKVVVNLRVIG